MSDIDRVERWLMDLDATLSRAPALVERGRGAFDSDEALPLAFEALANRVGDLAKRLVVADPARFCDPMWSQAARNRDFVVHHYDRVDPVALWNTVATSFPELAVIVKRAKG